MGDNEWESDVGQKEGKEITTRHFGRKKGRKQKGSKHSESRGEREGKRERYERLRH